MEEPQLQQLSVEDLGKGGSAGQGQPRDFRPFSEWVGAPAGQEEGREPGTGCGGDREQEAQRSARE